MKQELIGDLVVPPMAYPGIDELRAAGRVHCQTAGSAHYRASGKVQVIDLIIADGNAEGFCIGSIQKYAGRFKETQNLADLKKICDYAQILCGVKLHEQEGKDKPTF